MPFFFGSWCARRLCLAEFELVEYNLDMPRVCLVFNAFGIVPRSNSVEHLNLFLILLPWPKCLCLDYISAFELLLHPLELFGLANAHVIVPVDVRPDVSSRVVKYAWRNFPLFKSWLDQSAGAFLVPMLRCIPGTIHGKI